jgi:transposase
MARIYRREIDDDNHFLARRQREFRQAADALAEAWSAIEAVQRIALIGSVARPLWKELPRFGRYRRAGIELWHECKDLDLAIWLSGLAEAVGVNRRFVAKWLKARDEGGRRGRRPGEQPWLSEAEGARIKKLITDRCPDQLKLPFALWTHEAVRALIERETGHRLSLQAVSVYLQRWGFSAQRPKHRATERREPEVEAWLESAYPAIVKRAKAEKAEIHWGDETGLSNQANTAGASRRRARRR